MRMRLLISLLFYFILTLTFAQSQPQKIYLHPKTVAREKQSKFVDSLRFIALEINDKIEVGAYYSINVTEKYFLVNDYSNKRLLLYLKDGKFIKNISYKKLGDNFSPGYNERNNEIIFFGGNKNYALTTKDQIQIKLDWDNPNNRKYFKKYRIDLNNTALTIEKDVPSKRDINRLYHYYDSYYMQGEINVSPLYKDSVDYEFKIYKDNQLVKGFFPYNRINEPKFLYTQENIDFEKTDQARINTITRPYCDTIFKLVKDSLYPAYQFVLPLENSLPASFFNKPFKNKTERDNFKRNNGWMLHQIHNFYETPKYMYFMIRYLSNYEPYLYEKQTNITYRIKNIRSDSTQYNLNLLGDFSTLRKGNTFYKPVKASDLVTFFDKNENVPVPEELKEFLQRKPTGNTPVIAVYKFKD
jgi:hypothetical protein